MRCTVALLSGTILWLTAVGCSPRSATPTSTGAESTVRSYYKALLRNDWHQAYAVLHRDSRQQFTQEQFALKAQAYLKNINFEPHEVRIRSCEEQGNRALAHVSLVGTAAGKQRTYQDGITLRQDQSAWGVVLPPHFGEGR